MTEAYYIYPVCNLVQRLTLRLFADYAVTGQENVPREGPLIVVANHQSNLDPSLLSASVPRRLWFLAKDTIFKPGPPRWFLRSYGAHPLKRGSIDTKAFRWLNAKLDAGETIVIYPEGTRSTGRLQKALPGIARLALRAKAPLLPVGIVGTEGMSGFLRVINPTGTIRVKIGEPFTLPHTEKRPDSAELESLTDFIMHRIADLLPERYHGAYSKNSQASQTVPEADQVR